MRYEIEKCTRKNGEFFFTIYSIEPSPLNYNVSTSIPIMNRLQVGTEETIEAATKWVKRAMGHEIVSREIVATFDDKNTN